jgi:hypothetical protein
MLQTIGGLICQYLEQDHMRMDDALRRATDCGEPFDSAAYMDFRGALLRHIGIEEKILFPAARAANSGDPLQHIEQLHLDHGAIGALLVPTPTGRIVEAIKTILRVHNVIEEGEGGLYERCEELLPDAGAILVRIQAAPPVRMSAYVDNAVAMHSLRAALKRAGYSFGF